MFTVCRDGRQVRSFPTRDQAVAFAIKSGSFEEFEILDRADAYA